VLRLATLGKTYAKHHIANAIAANAEALSSTHGGGIQWSSCNLPPIAGVVTFDDFAMDG
jgi:cytochrome c oxidase assembly factor CtaG